MLVKPIVMGEQGLAIERIMAPGDVLASQDGNAGAPFVVDETAGGVTLTAAQFAQSISPALEVSGNGGAVATTLPTADQIIAAIRGNMNVINPPAPSPYDAAHDAAPPLQWPANLGVFGFNDTFRWLVRNLNGAGNNTITAQASSGVTVSGTATLATNTWREYIVRIISSAPTVIVAMSTTNANKVLTTTDLETVKRVQVGQSVFGTNIGASAKVTAVDYNTGNVTVDVNSTGTGGAFAITFTPTVVFTNLRAGTV
jgi:hypothetical protein